MMGDSNSTTRWKTHHHREVCMPPNQHERNWLEVRLLNRLNDRGHPVTLRDLRALIPDMEETITCAVFRLRDEGLVSVREIPGCHLVDITEPGRLVLAQSMALSDPGSL